MTEITKQIIVCKGDDADSYWDASTPEVWANNALAILTERYNQGYWYHPEHNEYESIKEVVEAQDNSFMTIGRGKWERQIPKAWNLLDARSDHEYEYVTLEVLRTVNND